MDVVTYYCGFIKVLTFVYIFMSKRTSFNKLKQFLDHVLTGWLLTRENPFAFSCYIFVWPKILTWSVCASVMAKITSDLFFFSFAVSEGS